MWAKDGPRARADDPEPELALVAHAMTQPPLTSMVAPLTKLARSDARKSTTWATSIGSAKRPRGTSAGERLAFGGGQVLGHEPFDRARARPRSP